MNRWCLFILVSFPQLGFPQFYLRIRSGLHKQAPLFLRYLEYLTPAHLAAQVLVDGIRHPTRYRLRKESYRKMSSRRERPFPYNISDDPPL